MFTGCITKPLVFLKNVGLLYRQRKENRTDDRAEFLKEKRRFLLCLKKEIIITEMTAKGKPAVLWQTAVWPGENDAVCDNGIVNGNSAAYNKDGMKDNGAAAR